MDDGKMRKSFENWASDEGKNPMSVLRVGDNYAAMQVQLYWVSWQACCKSDYFTVDTVCLEEK